MARLTCGCQGDLDFTSEDTLACVARSLKRVQKIKIRANKREEFFEERFDEIQEELRNCKSREKERSLDKDASRLTDKKAEFEQAFAKDLDNVIAAHEHYHGNFQENVERIHKLSEAALYDIKHNAW